MSAVPYPYRDRVQRVQRAKNVALSGSPSAPVAVTLPATSITDTTATLNGSVSPGNQATSVYFDYGLTDGYGTTLGPIVLSPGSDGVQVSVNIAFLTAAQTYHYRVRATNASGANAGLDQAFGTLAPPDLIPATPSNYGPAIAVLPSLLAQASPGTITIDGSGVASARIADVEYIGDVLIASAVAGTRRTPAGGQDAIAGLRVKNGQIKLRDLTLTTLLRNFEVLSCPSGKAAIQFENVGGGGGIDHYRAMACLGDGIKITASGANRSGATSAPWSTGAPDLIIGHGTVHADAANTTGTGLVVDNARNVEIRAIDYGTDAAYNGTGTFPVGALKIDGASTEADCEDVVVTSINPGANGTVPGDPTDNPTELPSLIDAAGATVARVQVLKAKRCGWRRSLHINALGSRPAKPCSLGGTTNATCVPTALVCNDNYAKQLVNYTFTSGATQQQRFPVDASLWGASTLLTDWSAAAYVAKQVDGRKPLGAVPTTKLSVTQNQVLQASDGVLVQANDGVWELVDKLIDATDASFSGAKTTTDTAKGAALTLSMGGGVTIYRPGDTADGNGGLGVTITLSGAVPSSWDPAAVPASSFLNASQAFMPTTLDTAVVPTLTAHTGIARLVTYKTVSGSTLTGCQLVDFTGSQIVSTCPLRNRSLSLHLVNGEALTAASNSNFGRAVGNARLKTSGTVRMVRCKWIDTAWSQAATTDKWIRRDCEGASSLLVDGGWQFDQLVGGVSGCWDPCSTPNDANVVIGANASVIAAGVFDWNRIYDHGHHGDWCDGQTGAGTICRNSTVFGGIGAGTPNANACTPTTWAATHADQMQVNRGQILPCDNVSFTAPAHTIYWGKPAEGAAGWQQVTAATRANPIRITTGKALGRLTGERIRIQGCDLAAANGEWVVTKVSAKVYDLVGSNGVGAPADGTFAFITTNFITAITTGATTRITIADGITNLFVGDQFTIHGVGGLTGAINATLTISNVVSATVYDFAVTTSGTWDGKGTAQLVASVTGHFNCCDLTPEEYNQPANPASGIVTQGGVTIQCSDDGWVDPTHTSVFPPDCFFSVDVNDCRFNPGDPSKQGGGGTGSWLYVGASGTATPSGLYADTGKRARNFWTVGGYFAAIGAGTTIVPGDPAYPH